jgi:GDP-L-fucose synthase
MVDDMSDVLVLGGSGFVGRNVCECFTENHIPFAAISRSAGVDLLDMDQSIGCLLKEKPIYIINCAAHVGSLNYVTEQAADVVSDNLRMILALYEAVAKAAPKAIIINPIANCAYPGKADTFTEDHWWDGHLHRSVLSYGGTRRMLWVIAECFQMQHNVRSFNLLVPNMYGPYDSTDPNKAHALNALVAKFVQAQKTKQDAIEIWGTGVAIREWLYAKDFGRAIVRILNNPRMMGLSEPVNIAQNFGLSVRELVDIISTYFPCHFDIKYDPSKPDGAPKKVMDDRKFRKVFPDFTFTPFEEGIRNTINYYNSIYPY